MTTTLARRPLLTQMIGLIPSRLLAALDAWSYHVALKHAQRRQRAATARAARAASLAAQHKVQSSRD